MTVAERYQLMVERNMLNVSRGAIIPEDICCLGLAGEVAEVCEQVLGAADPTPSPTEHTARRAAIIAELGDVLWYVTALAWHYDVKAGTLIDDSERKLCVAGAISLVIHTGAIADHIKKVQWHGKAVDQGLVLRHLRDTVSAIRTLAYDYGATMNQVMGSNMDKLRLRYPDGFVEGGGVRT